MTPRRVIKVTDFGTNRKPIYMRLLMRLITYFLPLTVSNLLQIIGQIFAFDRGGGVRLFITHLFGVNP